MMHLLAITFALLANPQGPRTGRHLVFSEDFSKEKTVNLKNWKFNDGPVYNHEREKYTTATDGNAYIKDGSLVLEAMKEGGKITSARLESTKTWRYGYFEIEAKVPKGKGTWPAIWMLNDRIRQTGPKQVGWPRCGEIDIMENVGYDPAGFHFSLHSENFNFHRKEQRTSVLRVKDPNGFHKFGLDWRPDSITFYYDGKIAYQVKEGETSFDSWPYVDKFYMILNLAIGGDWGGAMGVDDSIFPSRFYIKSINIYQ